MSTVERSESTSASSSNSVVEIKSKVIPLQYKKYTFFYSRALKKPAIPLQYEKKLMFYSRALKKPAIPLKYEKKLSFYSRALKDAHLEIGHIIEKLKKSNSSSDSVILSLKEEYLKCREELNSILRVYVWTNGKLMDAREELELTRARLNQKKEILEVYEDRVLTLEATNRRLRSLRSRSNLGAK